MPACASNSVFARHTRRMRNLAASPLSPVCFEPTSRKRLTRFIPILFVLAFEPCGNCRRIFMGPGPKTLLGSSRCPANFVCPSCCHWKVAQIETVFPLFGFIYIMTFNDDDNVWGKSCGGRREFVLLGNQWKFGIDGLSFWWRLIGGAYKGQFFS